MSKVVIYTRAYNAEKTIKRCIESILNQTYDNFVYYCLDNGSNDKTGDIIKDYANRDNRIIYWHNKINNVGLGKNDAVFSKDNSVDDYHCSLDADDEYTPDFLETMLAFMNENNLDIAACGNDFINAQTNEITGKRTLIVNLILENEKFGSFFVNYHQFMRTVWGKMYRIHLLKQCDFENYEELYHLDYGSDTLFCMQAFLNAKRAGILAKSLHKYYVSHKSTSHYFDSKRIVSDRILHDSAITFLINKVGFVSPFNREYLNRVYFGAIKETINVLLNARISISEKLAGLNEILAGSQSRELIDYNFMDDEEYNKLKEQLLK